jgi:hypothetical protein
LLTTGQLSAVEAGITMNPKQFNISHDLPESLDEINDIDQDAEESNLRISESETESEDEYVFGINHLKLLDY